MQKIKCNPNFIHPYTLPWIPLVSLTTAKLQAHLNINFFLEGLIQFNRELKKNPIIWNK